jgi:CheY-like chemotaxis protein
LSAHFKGDKKRLRQIMINLAGNAVKFTPVGHVIIRAASHSQDKDLICFEVSDTGMGIAQDQQQTIFEQFSKVDAGPQHAIEGSGLGLSISDRLVRMMGGEIAVKSEINKGSVFSFELQLEALPAQNVVPAQRLANRRALIVEPYAPLADILHNQLSLLGAETEINHGQHILEHINTAQPFDLILLDQAVHERALQLARSIKHINREIHPRIFLLKSPTVVISDAELDAAGISGTLTKPILFRELTDRLVNPSTAPEQPSQPSPMNKQHLHVLLVEDNKVNQIVARHFLERIGCTIDLVSNGREAVNAACSTHYDLIFMDCQMPIMDGYEATAAIRKNELQRGGEPTRVPIIALTAHALDADRAKCIEVGMDDYISKPIDQKVLKEIISTHSGLSFD